MEITNPQILSPQLVEVKEEPKTTPKSRFILMIPAVIALLIYILTLAPSISGNDAAELSLAVSNLGIAHPPGFPLYIIIGKIFSTAFPFTEPAWRLSLMSAICSASCVWILTLVVFKLSSSIIIAITTALLLAFTREFWKLSIAPSVYPLLLLSFMLSFYFLVLWYYRKQNNLLILSFLFAFLSITVHIIFLPHIFILFLFTRLIDPDFFKNSSHYLKLAGVFLLVLNIFVYIPIASGFNPVPDEGNPETFQEVLSHISAVSSLSPITKSLRPWSGIRETFSDTGSIIISQWFTCASFIPIISLIFVCLLGVMYFKKQNSPWLKFMSLLMAWAVLEFGVVVLFPFPKQTNQDIVRIMLPGTVCLVMLTGGALAKIWTGKQTHNPRSAKTWITCVAIVGIPVILLMYNLPRCNMSEWNFPKEHTVALLKSLPENSILIAHDRATFYRLYYTQHVTGLGSGVSLIDGRAETRRQGWDEFLVHVRQVSNIRPVFVTFKNPEEITLKFTFYPQCLAQRVVATYLGEGLVNSSSPMPELNFDHQFHELDLQDQNLVCEYFLTKAMGFVFEGKVEQSIKAFEKCMLNSKSVIYVCKRHADWFYKRKLTNECIGLLKHVITLNPDDEQAHKLLGKIYIQTGKYSSAIEHLENALKTRKRELETNLELARAYEAIADYSMAVAVYRRIIKWYPNHPAAYKELGTLLVKLKEEEEGKALLKKGLYLEHLEKLQQQMMPEQKLPELSSPSVPKPIGMPGQGKSNVTPGVPNNKDWTDDPAESQK